MIKTIAISSQKGGVAKTTTCLSLGASLVELGLSVLLIDMDPQANLTLSLGVNPELQRQTVGDALLEQKSLVAVSQEGTDDVCEKGIHISFRDRMLFTLLVHDLPKADAPAQS